jgi:superfamily II DNA or RNA helicase
MERALDEGRLCKYNYYPHLVELTTDENSEYKKYSLMLMRHFDSETNKYKDNQEVKELLLKRKNIINKARNKIVVFERIINEIYNSNHHSLKYTLVYVPEGNEPDYSKYEEYIEDEVDNKLINDYTGIISRVDASIIVRQFTSQSKDREQIIKSFTKGDTDVLTSMKCLDEGVDVPRSEIAIFCASSGNPRQFIQRRGRVLRTHPEKNKATIHDLIVIPNQNDVGTIDEFDRKLIINELARVVDFSNLAMNKIHTYNVLETLLDKYNINLYN